MIVIEASLLELSSSSVNNVPETIRYSPRDEKSNWLVNVKDRFWPDSIVWFMVSTIWFDELTE